MERSNVDEVLFQPFTLGPLTLRNRVFVPAHTTNFGKEGVPTDRHVAYHRERARGGVAFIISEGLRVHPTSRKREEAVGVFSDECIPGLARICEAVHDEGAHMFAQLVHEGRQTSNGMDRMAAWSPSSVPWAIGAHVPHAMSEEEIGVIVRCFEQAAQRMRVAGFDGIEVHLGHGHLLNQFMSPAVNRRTDAYGGSLSNRLRFPRQVLEGVFGAVGDELAVGIRISAHEFLPEGLTPEDMIQIVSELVADFPLAFVHVSHSAYVGGFSLATQIADMSFEPARFRSFPAAFKAAFPGVPVMAACRIDDLEIAASMVARDEVDLVGMARAHIADPHLIKKWTEGRPQTIRSCIACNQGCIGRIEQNLPLSCVVNPDVGLEAEWGEWSKGVRSVTSPNRRVLVVGGGPAGLQAALTARRRGLDVTLMDEHERLGGQVARYASALTGRGRFARLTEELTRDARAAGVNIDLGRLAVAAEILPGDWDAVVVATGSRPVPFNLPGIDRVLTTWEAIEGADGLGDHAAVFDEDGTWAGAGLAEHLASQRRRVELITPIAGLAWNVTTYSRLALVDRLGKAGVKVRPLRRPLRFEPAARLILADALTGEEEPIDDVTSVVYAGPRRANDALLDELRRGGFGGDLQLVGDAYAPRSALEAVFEGKLAGSTVARDKPSLTAEAPRSYLPALIPLGGKSRSSFSFEEQRS
jgi:2,4-dienoyl-CoA reductase-like NADH-dependent reductase (Old Yellow Enzyme family)/glycine/D-amino acid oxidase-like deaminating enzyme